MKKIFLLTVSVLLLSSCSQRMLDFTIVSTKNVDLSKASTFTRSKTRTEGTDIVHLIIYFPTGIPNMKEAIDRALEKVPGAIALVDGVVYHKYWWALVYGQHMYVVEGTPLIDPSLTDNTVKMPEYLIVKLNHSGEIKEYKEIDKKEYNTIKSKIINTTDVKYFNYNNKL
ncbi:MAG: lipoprotein [Bacteroidales bacterium]|nr:lipoprotein [Bacteroidales bacterium]